MQAPRAREGEEVPGVPCMEELKPDYPSRSLSIKVMDGRDQGWDPERGGRCELAFWLDIRLATARITNLGASLPSPSASNRHTVDARPQEPVSQRSLHQESQELNPRLTHVARLLQPPAPS
jgi:hypothetical protein